MVNLYLLKNIIHPRGRSISARNGGDKKICRTMSKDIEHKDKKPYG